MWRGKKTQKAEHDKHQYDSALIKLQGLKCYNTFISDQMNRGHSRHNSLSTNTVMNTEYCFCFSFSQWIWLHTHTSHHTECLFFLAHMLPYYFDIDSGSKSAMWGLKHWPWRAALATKTDGNPPANPSSSQPIITSQWPRALLPKPHSYSLVPSFPSLSLGEKDDAFLNLITISKISHKISPHGPVLGWWQGARRSPIPYVSES